MSDECAHLLHGLLERDPQKRISFDDFFNHTFIDLEHMPSKDCLPKAVSFDIVHLTVCLTCTLSELKISNHHGFILLIVMYIDI